MGCPGGLALLVLCACKTFVHLEGMVLPELICWMENVPASKSSSSLESSSLSTSLEGHASSSGGTEDADFFSASSEFSSPSTSTSTPRNQSIDCSSNNEPKESLEFLSKNEQEFWKREIIRAFEDGLDEVDPRGKIGKIPQKDIVEAFRLTVLKAAADIIPKTPVKALSMNGKKKIRKKGMSRKIKVLCVNDGAQGRAGFHEPYERRRARWSALASGVLPLR